MSAWDVGGDLACDRRRAEFADASDANMAINGLILGAGVWLADFAARARTSPPTTPRA